MIWDQGLGPDQSLGPVLGPESPEGLGCGPGPNQGPEPDQSLGPDQGPGPESPGSGSWTREFIKVWTPPPNTVVPGHPEHLQTFLLESFFSTPIEAKVEVCD